jgi:hypothetical protein
MIRHTVVFRLRHRANSAEEKAFLAAGKALAAIPGVEKFEQMRQVSPKNGYAFGFSMEFADQAAYDRYNSHPTTSPSSTGGGSRRSRSSSRSTTCRCERKRC